jgi:2-polyprenyl-3-methyl-5-hydroxy-6-metoxy-1,4-benzoquinol methylase
MHSTQWTTNKELMEHCTPITECLACGGQNLVATLNLGQQPLANSFRNTPRTDNELQFPLSINRCDHCNHLQLTHAVNPELIYRHYLYVSGTSKTLLDYMDWYAHFVREQFGHWVDTVLDIGCNDGSQLDSFKKAHFRTWGVDPAENLYPVSSARHIVVCGFWNEDTAAQLGREQFDVITTQNAFAHVPDPLPYLKLCKQHLRDDGKIFISTSQADMVINGEFDTIYHEHISYYNAYSMKCLAERAGLYLADVVKTPIHGTSYIFVLSKRPLNQYRVQNILAQEQAAGLQTAMTYYDWNHGVEDLLGRLAEQVEEFRGFGLFKHVIGYGAAAKGMTLINASRLRLDVVVDDNPLKQGLYCPGTDISVVSSDYIQQIPTDEPVLFIPLAWNFYQEINKKIKLIRNQPGDAFMRYFPQLRTDFNEDQI